jgi:hypothetical protein
VSSFINSAFVQQNGLTLLSSAQMQVEVANGEQVTTKGVIQLKLSIQKYTETLKLHVIDLTPGFDVILGDSWAKANGVLAGYEYPPDGDPRDPSYSPPMLILRSKGKVLYPRTHKTSTVSVSNTAKVISAVQAARLLACPRFGCAPPFLVQIRACKDDSDANSCNAIVQHILNKYPTVFEEPKLTEVKSTLGDI